MGTVFVTPEPESTTNPVVLPEEYKAKTADIEIKRLGTLKVSNIASVVFSLFSLGFNGTN